MSLHAYIPQDRLRAIANNTTLPDRTSGAALFADISGFTMLTKSLHETLGARQGAEELTKQLGKVYSALIGEIEKYGGSVIGFAGDSMLCWFNDAHGSSSMRATSCAFAMQMAIKEFPALALKVAITSGDARRFVVGDEKIQRIDALAGSTVTRTATGEHLAGKGDVLVDEVTMNTLQSSVIVKEWRKDGVEKFAVVVQAGEGDGQSLGVADSQTITPVLQALRPYVHQTVYEREANNQSAFLTEFRPCAALFIRFTGINYDSDQAEGELDTFIREVQRIAIRYEGALMQLTIGDKGCYAYVNFGALSAHEDDSRRAVKTALELRNKSELQLQMGITQGLMRTGAYGCETRKTYGALGDDVNLAAWLMTAAKENEILLSSNVHKVVKDDFTFEPHSPLPMKGKAEPLPIFAVTGESQKRAVRLQEPNYSLPMVGRVEELKHIEEKLDLAREGKSQVIGIVAEAGLGKSRLVAEVIRSARKKGFVGFGGACQSDAIHTPYQAWKSIWQAFFDVDHEMAERKLMRWIEGEIEDRAPSRVDAMPLLNVVLDLNIPENDFTQNLEPKTRQSALHALLEDCLKAAAKDQAILIVIEDMHWVDALSHELLEQLAKALVGHAVCFVLAYRPPQMERLQSPRIEALAQFTRIELHELTAAEAESAIRAKLTQLYPARSGALPTGLVDALMARAQGNPFYLEELLNYVRDRGLDPADIGNIELPNSLHTLILSRIDQLSEYEKTTLRVASIVGRSFRAKWLTGYYPELGSFTQVKAALDELDKLEITPLDSEPELTYLFKHIVTHEVTYESLPFATRARLHEQLAKYLEKTGISVDTIAFHYVHSENKEKKCEYLLKAGEAAQKSFASDTALEYYGQLLPLLNNLDKQAEVHLKRGQVLEISGKWVEAEKDYHAALNTEKMFLRASVQFALGKLNRLRGNHTSALEWLDQAKKARTKLEDKIGLAQVLIETGMVLYHKSEFILARDPLNDGLKLAKEAGDLMTTAQALNNLGSVALFQGDYPVARAHYEEGLALRRKIGDKVGMSASLNNLGGVAYAQGDYTAARALHEESLSISREIGVKHNIAISLINVGLVAQAQEDYSTARTLYEENLKQHREMGDKRGMTYTLGNLGMVVLAQKDYAVARTLFEETLAICKEIDEKPQMGQALLGLGLTLFLDAVGDKLEARKYILQSLRLRQETGEQWTQTSSLVGVAGLELDDGDATFSAQLLAAVDSALKMLNAVIEPDVKSFREQTLAQVKQALGDEGFQSAWEEGSKWSLDEAVKRVLGE